MVVTFLTFLIFLTNLIFFAIDRPRLPDRPDLLSPGGRPGRVKRKNAKKGDDAADEGDDE